MSNPQDTTINSLTYEWFINLNWNYFFIGRNFLTTKKVEGDECRTHACKVLPKPMLWARIHPRPLTPDLTLLTDSMQFSHMKRRPANCHQTINHHAQQSLFSSLSFPQPTSCTFQRNRISNQSLSHQKMFTPCKPKCQKWNHQSAPTF